MKNKKGALLFAPMLLILMIVGLIYAYSEISAKYKRFNKEIGEKQFELINTYQEGEKLLFYIDQSAKYSAYQGVYDLAKHGGCSSGNEYNGYRLWAVDSPRDGICYPSAENSKNGLFHFVSNNLNNYLSKYYAKFNKPIFPSNNYDFALEDGTIIGIAKSPLVLPITDKKSGSELGRYSIKAPFKVNIENYDFADYDKLKSRSQGVINECENVNPKRVPVNCVNEDGSKNIFSYENLALSTCMNGRRPVEFLDYKWDSDVRSSIYGFCVKSSNPKVYAYEESDNTIGLKNITYRFALSFEDLECTLQGHPELVNTKCKESSCSGYYDCRDATPLCYCAPGTVNEYECQGECLTFCSIGSISSGRVEDTDSSTKCKMSSCSSYMSCGTINPADKCWCPADSPAASYACEGSNCDTLHCDRDTSADTQCKDDCGKYGSCSTTSSCECGSGSDACEGSCSCDPEEWEDTGGCGDITEDGKEDCDWNEKPQKQEYTPSGCSSTEYRCEAQSEEVCPEPATDSCRSRCRDQASGCSCDTTCEDDKDCCEDYSESCGDRA